MNEALARDLYLKYPKIFLNDEQTSRSDTQVFCSLDIGDGWYDIIDQLCGCIQNHLDWKNAEGRYEGSKKHRSPEELKNSVPQVKAEQVKEKFASLRFYHTGGDDTIDGMVSMAEAISERTCETCGAPGKRTSGGWMRTLCRKHADEAGRQFDDIEEEDL